MPDRAVRTLDQWLAYIEQLHPFTIDMGLDRIKAVALTIMPLCYSCPVITVAGTNGKGTTVTVLEAIALSQGKRVATYTSPHIWHFHERIKINGLPLDDQTLIDAFEVVESARGDVTLTYFEFTSLAAFWLFHQEPLDLVVLEVGMGGRLDACNMIEPDVAVITSISYDHMGYLGDTLEAIASEKCGIMRAGKPIICGEHELSSFINARAELIGALFQQVDDRPYVAMNPSLVPSNIACAHLAASFVGIPIELQALKSIVSRIRIPGRAYHTVMKGKQLILDVAHNAASIERLTQYIEGLKPNRIVLVLGILADKVMDDALIRLCGSVDEVILSTPQTPRALPASDLSDRLALDSSRVSIIAHPKEALDFALSHAREDDYIVVTGSFYMVAM